MKHIKLFEQFVMEAEAGEVSMTLVNKILKMHSKEKFGLRAKYGPEGQQLTGSQILDAIKQSLLKKAKVESLPKEYDVVIKDSRIYVGEEADNLSLTDDNLTLGGISYRFDGFVSHSLTNYKSRQGGSDKAVKLVVAKLGKDASVSEVADFVYTNYAKITGLPKSKRDAEGAFPEEIEAVIDYYGFDLDEFSQAYGN